MKNLKKLFNDNRKGRIEIKASGDETTIYLYDAIGGWSGVEASEFVKEIADISAKTIHLRVNCPGGDVFDARAIQTGLKQHSAKVVAHIDGVAASAATYIALAADEIEMADGAFFMIHNAWTFVMGNADELREMAALMDKIDSSIVKDYQIKTNQSEEQIKTWMSAETWFTAEEALEHGFVDSIYEGEEVENYNLSAYNNAPKMKEPGKSVRAQLERRLTLVNLGA